MSQPFLPWSCDQSIELAVNEEFDERETEENKKESKEKVGTDEFVLSESNSSESPDNSISKCMGPDSFKAIHFLSIITPPPEKDVV